MSFIWETLKFEDKIQNALKVCIGDSHGITRFGYYTSARKYLLEDHLEEIKGIQPRLTDHGPRHIRNVLENLDALLGDDIDKLNGMELYVLGLSALFHDVGNIFDRKEHQRHIYPVYDSVMVNNGGNEDNEQKKLVLEICKAHCGEGDDGSKDTLQFVSERSKIEKQEIRSVLLAPLLRFADELAEGEQRTSHFMINNHHYKKDEINYHIYASACRVDIDRQLGRIGLSYHIKLKSSDSEGGRIHEGGPLALSIEELKSFLPFIYNRIEKVNQERQYTKHYCYLLSPFKETSASFTFWYKGQEVPVALSPVVFSDLVIPGDHHKRVSEQNSAFIEKDLIDSLSDAMKSME